MTDQAALEARALARLPEVLRALLSPGGWPTGDAKAFHPQAARRRWRFTVDPFSGDWLETGHMHEPQRGEGLVAVVALVCALPPAAAAEALATILGRLDRDPFADAIPMTAPVVCNEYRDVTRAMDRRRRSLRMTFEELDHVSGVASGYSAKVVGMIKGLSHMSMPSLMGALKLSVVLVPIETVTATAKE